MPEWPKPPLNAFVPSEWRRWLTSWVWIPFPLRPFETRKNGDRLSEFEAARYEIEEPVDIFKCREIAGVRGNAHLVEQFVARRRHDRADRDLEGADRPVQRHQHRAHTPGVGPAQRHGRSEDNTAEVRSPNTHS